jgi:hypothetical protein
MADSMVENSVGLKVDPKAELSAVNWVARMAVPSAEMKVVY